ncbi:MAG: TonB-dependent receptor plug domain-containing protein, partial [Pseudomonadota bacterium]
MSKSPSRLYVLVASVLMVGPAYAQSAGGDAITLQGIVIESDNRVETPVTESTRSVTVVTREQIEKQTSTTTSVADIIANTVPGFSPSTEANTDFG